MKSQLTTEIKRLEQEHRDLSQDYQKQKGIMKEIDTALTKTKDPDERKALEIRKTDKKTGR